SKRPCFPPGPKQTRLMLKSRMFFEGSPPPQIKWPSSWILHTLQRTRPKCTSFKDTERSSMTTQRITTEQ
ncbi:hypothetical protein HDU99_009534, partial [Rhizoclosmatium hyalinum]